MSVYCVFVKDNGGYFLEKIFENSHNAFDYREAMGGSRMGYYVEEWETE